GYDILSKADNPVFKMAADIARYHHEKWDGSGYPLGLAGEAIPEAARIVAIADVFDALTTKRPYKEPWTLDDTLQTMRQNAGSHLDPHLFDRFLQIMPEILSIRATWGK
ncbi:MAG: HD domain-containing phosphohydrolase, partial [Methylococcales bacterium]|nr:HD domain-containing phosphohydrolase [Methylococcales bacterium]